MSAVQEAHLEVVQESSMSKEEVLYGLVALGVNSCIRSYDNDMKKLKEEFLSLPLSEIAKSWSMLDPNVKIQVVDKHNDSFLTWCKEG